MKVLWILVVFALSVSALPIEEDDRVNGENGWYVPQADGSSEWVDMEEADAKMEQLELMENRGLTVSPVTFYLYTLSNPTKGKKITASKKSISKSNFNPANPTRFVIHGWTQSVLDPMNKNIRQAWFSHGDFNIIFVDWARARSVDYASSVLAVPAVGKRVANMINFLVGGCDASLDDIHLVGHSLGAHVAGYAGKNTKGQVHTIVGLDPALPLFHYSKPSKRLASTDAYYVESIQTDIGGLGFAKPIGKGSFYPNGGKDQPGCPLDVTGACSHGRSVTYYVEAVKYNDFPTMKCHNYINAIDKSCGSTYSTVRMGTMSNAYMVAGDYYVPVKSKSPYGMGK